MSNDKPIRKMGTKSSVAFGLLIAVAFTLRLAVRLLRATDSTPEFDLDQIDFTPVIAQVQQQQTDRAVNDAMRVIRVAGEQGREVRNRWETAEKQGLIGATGVIYVPSKRKLSYDGSPNEFGPAQTTPPKTGFYVVLTRTKQPNGHITAKVIGRSAKDGPPAIAASKPMK